MVYAEEYNIQLIRVASNLIKVPNIQISLINPVDNIMMFVRDCCHLSQCMRTNSSKLLSTLIGCQCHEDKEEVKDMEIHGLLQIFTVMASSAISRFWPRLLGSLEGAKQHASLKVFDPLDLLFRVHSIRLAVAGGWC